MTGCKFVRLLAGVILALAMAGLACNAAANLPNPFASPTPTATPTLTPSPTPSPTPTYTPSPTPLPTGTQLDKQPDGSTRFLDYDGKYMIQIPSIWSATRIDEADFQEMATQVARTNPQLVEGLPSIDNLNSDVFRIVAFDTNSSHYADHEVANFSVTMSKESMATALPLDIVVKATIDEMKGLIPSAKFTQLGPYTNPHGLKIGAVEVRMTVKGPEGISIAAYQKLVFFQTKTALVVITFTSGQSVADQVKPTFDQVIDGVELMEP